MATFTKRNGQRGTSWEARIRKKGYPTITKTFSLKADEEKWAIHTERSLERGNYSSYCESQTLGDVLKRYANDVTPNKRGAEQELFRIGKLLQNSLSDIRLSELKPTDIVKYRDQRLHVVTPTSVLKESILLNHSLDTAKKEWGVNLPINPLHDVRRPKANPQRDRRLGFKEFERLLVSCSEERVYWFYPLIIFAIETTMRRGEIIEVCKLYIRVAGGFFILLLLLTLWMPEPPEPLTFLEKVVQAFKASYLWPFEITDTQAFMLWNMIGVPFLIYGIGMWGKKEDIADMLVTAWFGWPIAIAIVGMALFYLIGLLFLASL